MIVKNFVSDKTRFFLLRMLESSGSVINIGCVDPLGRTALLMAIDNENMEMVELLLENKVENRGAFLNLNMTMENIKMHSPNIFCHTWVQIQLCLKYRNLASWAMRVSGRYLEGIGKVEGRCLERERLWKVCAGIWKVSERCLDSV